LAREGLRLGGAGTGLIVSAINRSGRRGRGTAPASGLPNPRSAHAPKPLTSTQSGWNPPRASPFPVFPVAGPHGLDIPGAVEVPTVRLGPLADYIGK